MERLGGRWRFGLFASLLAAVLLPAIAVARGPIRGGNGEPDDDMQLSVVSPEHAAFVQRKLALAAAMATGRWTDPTAPGSVAPMFQCEFDPCESAPPSYPPPTSPPASQPAVTPPPSGPTPAKTLATRARQQSRSYFCGPAAGQVVINWSRGIIKGNNDGEDVTTNWRSQSKIAEWMKTTTSGTGGANLAAGLNNPNGVLKPTSDWTYLYADNGLMPDLLGKIVTDIDRYSMPLVLATAPHESGVGVNFLESWPKVVAGAHHWIVVRGYDLTGSASNPVIKYQDSSAGFGGATGAFDDYLSVMYQVSKLNQGGHVVW